MRVGTLRTIPTPSAVRLYIWDHRGFGAFVVTTGAIGLEGTDSIELLAQVARGIKEHGLAYAVWASVHDDDPNLETVIQQATCDKANTIGQNI